MSSNDRFDHLGTSLAKHLGEGPGDDQRARQRRALVASASPSVTSARPVWRWVIAGSALAVVAVLAWLAAQPEDARIPWLSETLHAAQRTGAPDARTLECRDVRGVRVAERSYVAAQQDEQELVFSDGSRVRLRETARLLVDRVRPEEVHLRLEVGGLRADVKGGGDTVWRTTAGPYLVEVMAGQLELTWEPAPQRLTVEISQGEAFVEGATLVGGRIKVRAPEKVVVTVRGDDVRRSPTSATQPTSAKVTPPPPARPEPPAAKAAGPARTARKSGTAKRRSPPKRGRRVGVREPSSKPPPAAKPKAVSSPVPSPPASTPKPRTWKELAANGDYKAAFESVSRRVDTLKQTATSRELVALADVARLAGRPKVASTILKALRQRFSHGSDRARATFRLGRLAMDQLKDHARAVGWFQTYLREYPRGSRVGPARGRLMQALMRLGRRGQAKQVARAYLEHSPAGTFCPVAQKIVGGDSAACEKR